MRLPCFCFCKLINNLLCPLYTYTIHAFNPLYKRRIQCNAQRVERACLRSRGRKQVMARKLAESDGIVGRLPRIRLRSIFAKLSAKMLWNRREPKLTLWRKFMCFKVFNRVFKMSSCLAFLRFRIKFVNSDSDRQQHLTVTRLAICRQCCQNPLCRITP